GRVQEARVADAGQLGVPRAKTPAASGAISPMGLGRAAIGKSRRRSPARAQRHPAGADVDGHVAADDLRDPREINVLKLAYANARFRPDAHDGANAHVRQFVQNTVALGHEVWMSPGVAHPLTKELPRK